MFTNHIEPIDTKERHKIVFNGTQSKQTVKIEEKKRSISKKRSSYRSRHKFNAEFYLMKSTLDSMLSMLRLLRNYIIKHFGTKFLIFFVKTRSSSRKGLHIVLNNSSMRNNNR